MLQRLFLFLLIFAICSAEDNVGTEDNSAQCHPFYTFVPCSEDDTHGVKRFYIEYPTEIRIITFCTGEDCPKPWPDWLVNLLEEVRLCHNDMSPWIFVVACLVFAYICYGIYVTCYSTWTYKKSEHILSISICIPFTKVCRQVYTELDNGKPLLERFYGQLILDHDDQFTYISIVVCPRFAKQKFHLKDFLDDVLSINQVERNLSGIKKDVKIFVKKGSSKDAHKAWFKEAVLRQQSADTGISTYTGRIVLRFDSGSDLEGAVLRDFRDQDKAKRSLQDIFNRNGLEYKDSRQGSVRIRFYFPRNSDTFDAKAEEMAVEKLVTDLLSHESFKRRDKAETLQAEFILKSSIRQIPVIQAESLVAQIGLNNHIHVGFSNNDQTQQSTESGAQIEDDDIDVFDRPTWHSTSKELIGEFLSLYVLRIPGVTNVHDALAEDVRGLRYKPEVIPVDISCDPCTAELLHKEWTDILRLLQRHWPGCELCRRRDKVWWQLDRNQTDIMELSNFIGDLFSTKRLQKIKRERHVAIHAPLTLMRAGFCRRVWRAIKSVFQMGFCIIKNHIYTCIAIIITIILCLVLPKGVIIGFLQSLFDVVLKIAHYLLELPVNIVWINLHHAVDAMCSDIMQDCSEFQVVYPPRVVQFRDVVCLSLSILFSFKWLLRRPP